jgi:TPR repeat protein
VEDKNKEVRIALIVIVVLLVIFALASLWTANFNVVAWGGSGTEDALVVDADTVREAAEVPQQAVPHSASPHAELPHAELPHAASLHSTVPHATSPPIAGATEAAGNRAGKQVLNNKLLAAEAYRRSADSGNAEAQFKMGEAYSNGQVVPLDPMAIIWYRKSAAQGFALAQYRLGVIYLQSERAPRYLVVAYALFSVAAASAKGPVPDAGQQLRELRQTMTVLQIQDGDALAEQFDDLDSFLSTLDRALR